MGWYHFLSTKCGSWNRFFGDYIYLQSKTYSSESNLLNSSVLTPPASPLGVAVRSVLIEKSGPVILTV